MDYISITLIFLSLFYGFYSILSIIRLINVVTEKKIYYISILFYIGLFFTCLSRGGAFILLITQKESPKQTQFVHLLVAIPDMINVCEFLIIIWHFFTHYIISHICVANDINFIYHDDTPKMKRITNYVLYVLLPLYMSGCTIFCLLELFDVLDFQKFFIINAILIIVFPFIFLGYYIFLSIKFSGRPYKDKESKDETNLIFTTAIIWGIARIFVGVVEICVQSYDFITTILAKKDQWKFCIVIVGYFIITEFLGNYLALDPGIAKSFIKKGSLNEEVNSSVAEEEKNLRGEVLPNESEESIQVNKNIKAILKEFIVQPSDIEIKEELFGRKSGLGKIYKGTFKNMEVACRVILFERLSRYEIENISNDIENIITFSHSNVCSPIGICFEENPKIVIISQYYQNGSLHDYIHENNHSLDKNQKLNIALGVLSGLKYLHDRNRVHFHLSSRNIYLDDELNPLIADIGFDYLKNNANIFIKYMNKNAYSPPEILADSEGISHSLEGYDYNKQIDIYSFGILLWELFTETIPFNIKLSELRKYIVEEKCRPEIPKNFDKTLAELIRECWDTDPKGRPSIDKIIETLKSKIK